MIESFLEKEILKIIKEFKLPSAFPKKVLDEVCHLSSEIGKEEIRKRVDLRDEVIVTIDGEQARDFDDAISISRVPDGGFVLKVSIADVSHFIRSGSAVDQEALNRGTSVYFPDRVIPMLPEKLSNELCSLVPHEDRLAFTAEMNFDEGGCRLSSRFYRSVIRSVARLTYTKVRQILVDREPEVRRAYAHLIPHLEMMEGLADKIQQWRMRRGSLDFDLPEPLIELDLEEGKIDRIVRAERNKAHRLIEEFMIAANEAVAEFITSRHAPMIYRVHGEPDPEKLGDFSILLNNLGFSFHLGKKIRPHALVAVIAGVRGKPEERLVNTLLLRTMKQAIYDTRNIGHFGLASTCYTHFTSPIRRYPDLIVHRILEDMLRSSPSLPGSQKKGQQGEGVRAKLLQNMANHCSERERNAMKTEYATRDLVATLFMGQKIGEVFRGIISGVTKFGFFVELIPFFVEGRVSLKDLRDDYYVFHEKNHSLQGRRKKKKYQIGMPVCIRVKGIHREKRWIDFEVVQKG